MRLESVRRLSGPNIFTAAPVTIARLELDDLTCRESTDYPGFTERLLMALPGLREHHCAAGRPGGFVEKLTAGTYFGHVTEHVTLELSALAGRDVHLGRTMWAGADGRYDVMTQCPPDEPEDSAVPGELIRLAITVVTALLAKRRPDFGTDLAAIGRTVERERLGPSTAALAAAARRRGIPVRRVAGLSMLKLGYGCHRRLVSAALTEQTSALGVDIAGDKVLAKQILARAGVPVPEGMVAHSAAEAVEALAALTAPVVIKPRNGNHGRSVTVGVRTGTQAQQAYRRAAAGSGSGEVIVETYAPGRDHRVLVVGGRVVAAAELRPPAVTGDGERSITELVAELNADPRRGDGHARVLTRVLVDDAVLGHLATGGLTPDSVPALGQVVTLRRNGNLSTGGTSRDVTDLIHPDVAELCRRAAAAACLDVCGVDIRLEDVGAPLHGAHAQRAAVIEVNACPGLRMHLAPAEGAPRDVAEAIIDRLYPPAAAARIPVVSVTGTNGKTTTVRMIAHVLRQAGLRTGMSCTDGVYIDGQCVLEADASGPRSAEIVLDDTSVEAAVLETARGGILRRGLGYDRADVAVVTNISADHLGDDGIDDLDELVHVKALVAEEITGGGSLVLNADDPVVAAIASRPAVARHDPVIRYFSIRPESAMLTRHRRAGGICYQVRDGQITEFAQDRERPIMAVAELPGAFGGRAPHLIANALAAVAACRALGVTVKDIRAALTGFTPAGANPGRGNVYAVPVPDGAAGQEGPVIVDYGHNAAALQATGEFVTAVWGGDPIAVLTLPGDRRDDLITASAQAVAAWFGRVVLYEDHDLRGRQTGEMRTLVAAALRKARPGIQIGHAHGPADALRVAVEQAAGDAVLFVYEEMPLARTALEAVGAIPAPEPGLAEPGLPEPGLPEPALPEPGLPEPALPDPALPGPASQVPQVDPDLLDEIEAEFARSSLSADTMPISLPDAAARDHAVAAPGSPGQAGPEPD